MPTQSLGPIDSTRVVDPRTPLGTNIQRLNTQVAAVSTDLSGRFSITTAEGDTIELTADLQTDVRAVKLHQRGGVRDEIVSADAKYEEFALRRGFDVVVEGDLNEKELHELETIVPKIEQVLRRFLLGQDEHGLSKTIQLADRFAKMSSLASLDFSLEVERSATMVAAQVVSEYLGQPVSGTSEDSSSLPTDQRGPLLLETPDNRNEETRMSRPASEEGAPASLAEQILTVFKESNLEIGKIQAHLASLFDKVREELRHHLQNERSHAAEQQRNALEPPAVYSTVGTAVVSAYQALLKSDVSLTMRI